MSFYEKMKKKGAVLISLISNKRFQKLFVGILAIVAAFIIIGDGASPKKYRLNLWDKSLYDITAPRDIENKMITEQNARASAAAVPPVIIRMDNVPIDVLNNADDFMTIVDEARKSVDKNLQNQGITTKDRNYEAKLALEQENASRKLQEEIRKLNIILSDEQVQYLVTRVNEEELGMFKKVTRQLLSDIMKQEITADNLTASVNILQDRFQDSSMSQELKNIGSLLVKAILKPNSTIDDVLTSQKRNEAYNNAKQNAEIIKKGSRILSMGDTVTADKLQVLEELNMLETGRFDIVFAVGIFVILALLATLLIVYMNFFCKKVLNNRDDIILLSVIILLTLVIARIVNSFSALLIPIFIASMLVSILLDLNLAIVVNFILAIALTFITKGDMSFFYLGAIGGTFSAFLVSKANQRNKLSASGLMIAAVNMLVIASLGIINKKGVRDIAQDCLIVSINGIISTIFTIGILPFLESTFSVITPLKLMELANPNQPLIKRLLIEAPGTYHHSLMVGNLAEVASEAIGGNALLARVGAYYHDIGKLKRPNFFIENQISDNPHDRMEPNLSTLIITSHTHDGVEIARKYKLPLAIREIIAQHHGNTVVAYFYHKAKKNGREEAVKKEDFRYNSPKPVSKEAAVVMLADSVEAAVRSMEDRTEGKIAEIVSKIIKDRLNDGQLNTSNLTLKDLDDIARSFIRVFSGYFHGREDYPDEKPKNAAGEEISLAAAGVAERSEIPNGNEENS